MSHTVLRPTFTRNDERGILREILNTGVWQSLLQGEMKAGAVMGNHYHQETEVFFFLLSGQVRVVTEHTQTKARDEFTLKALEGVMLRVMESHAITFQEPSVYLLFKSLPYDPQAPDTYHYPV